MPDVEAYDKDRDARTFQGEMPVVAHPPCRAWGRLRHFAKPEPGEKQLAVWAVTQVRKWGGVLEHPECSQLWERMNLPLGNQRDPYGGYTISIDQFWWGHRARKRTWLYICGVDPNQLPEIPLRFDAITHTVSTTMHRNRKYFRPKPTITKAEREATPKEFAEWLVKTARLCT